MKKVLIVEDEFIEAKNLERMMLKSSYEVCGIARSVAIALSIIEKVTPDFVLIDIFLKGDLTGIDLAKMLRRQNIPFLYLSANSNKTTLDAAKATRPFGFLVKPFREKDVLAMLEIAIYQHDNGLESLLRQQQSNLLTKSAGQVTEIDIMNEIIGQSEALNEALKFVRIVAPSSTSVMILGESGTGKEMIAQAIHELSPRKNKIMIKVNCGALPVTLIESVLFGHEKGAFTGATDRHIGKFEQAQNSTLFLDEIGEIPPEVQVKLLRALQEREIERLGGKETIKIDVRIIAATNRNLEKEMAEGRFRIDLYYRLNVFPIHLAPLRQRKEDILLLANHFVEKFCKMEGMPTFALPGAIIEQLLSHHWPGNIRELENTIKRMVLMYPHHKHNLAASLFMTTPLNGSNQAQDGKARGIYPGVEGDGAMKSWQEYERHYILYVLKKCEGKISGNSGAAKVLNLPASTLESKMKRLGIKKEDYLPGK